MLSINPSFFPLPLWNSPSKSEGCTDSGKKGTDVPNLLSGLQAYVSVLGVSHFPQANVTFLAVGDMEQELSLMYKCFLEVFLRTSFVEAESSKGYPLFTPFC